MASTLALIYAYSFYVFLCATSGPYSLTLYIFIVSYVSLDYRRHSTLAQTKAFLHPVASPDKINANFNDCRSLSLAVACL